MVQSAVIVCRLRPFPDNSSNLRYLTIPALCSRPPLTNEMVDPLTGSRQHVVDGKKKEERRKKGFSSKRPRRQLLRNSSPARLPAESVSFSGSGRASIALSPYDYTLHQSIFPTQSIFAPSAGTVPHLLSICVFPPGASHSRLR